MEIGPVRESDLDAISTLHAHFWGEVSDVAAMRETLTRLGEDSDHILLSARIDGACIGTATGAICHGLYGGSDSYLVIEDVVVDQGHRRLGVATALLGELERQARARGCKQMIVLTEAVREDAVALYEATGFAGRWRGFKRKLDAVPASKSTSEIVKHVVLWKLAPEADGRSAADNAREVKRRLETLSGTIPGMLHLEVGIDTSGTDASADVALYSVFDSQEALDAYQTHPAHVEISEFVSRVRESRTAVDYRP